MIFVSPTAALIFHDKCGLPVGSARYFLQSDLNNEAPTYPQRNVCDPCIIKGSLTIYFLKRILFVA